MSMFMGHSWESTCHGCGAKYIESEIFMTDYCDACLNKKAEEDAAYRAAHPVEAAVEEFMITGLMLGLVISPFLFLGLLGLLKEIFK